jgi:hypothetical protein
VITVELFRTLIISYLIVTLGSTSLAKFKSWRTTSAGILRESVVPVKVATAVVIIVAVIELSLATLLMLGVEPAATSIATAGLFLSFGAYRMAVAARTSFLMCTCAGTLRAERASPPAVAGAILACLIQASLAGILILVGHRPGLGLYDFPPVAAWMAPFIAFVVGTRRRDGGSHLDDRLPAVFTSLAWPNVPAARSANK